MELKSRIDAAVSSFGWRLTQRNMFGSVAYFTPADNMCFAVMGGDGLLFRVGKNGTAAYLTQVGVHEARMGKRNMTNWLLASGQAIAGDGRLADVMKAGYDFAMTLPPK